jgi:uncharacterized protein (DUF1810 family)
MTDPHDLQRFLDAQAPVYAAVCDELRAGRKRSHWMWYIFPQLQGLGASPMAQRYAIASLDEAKAYLAHPVLGARLRECASLAAGIEGRSVGDIFGYPDDMKFRSSMTLFSRAAPDEAVIAYCLEKYFDGEPDRLTLDSLPRA